MYIVRSLRFYTSQLVILLSSDIPSPDTQDSNKKTVCNQKSEEEDKELLDDRELG